MNLHVKIVQGDVLLQTGGVGHWTQETGRQGVQQTPRQRRQFELFVQQMQARKHLSLRVQRRERGLLQHVHQSGPFVMGGWGGWGGWGCAVFVQVQTGQQVIDSIGGGGHRTGQRVQTP